MKTPTTPFTVLALALALAGSATQARAEAPVDLGDTPSDVSSSNDTYLSSPDNTIRRTSDGKIIMPDDFVGPLAPNQIYKKDAGTAELGSFATTTNALQSIGKLQASESGVVTPDPEIVAYEDQMKADGTVKDVIRQAKGAIIVLPDGKVSWSDYGKKFNTMPFDLAGCGANPSCPPELKAYAEKQAQADKEKKETAQQDKNMFKSNMFAGDNGGSQDTPADSQDPPQDTEKVAALETGAGIGDFLRDQWRQSPDSGSGGIGGDIGAGGAPAGEVGKIETADLNVSQIPLTYEHNIKFESKIPERIEGLRKALDQGASGKGDDLAPNTAPSKGVVATHQ